MKAVQLVNSSAFTATPNYDAENTVMSGGTLPSNPVLFHPSILLART